MQTYYRTSKVQVSSMKKETESLVRLTLNPNDLLIREKGCGKADVGLFQQQEYH